MNDREGFGLIHTAKVARIGVSESMGVWVKLYIWYHLRSVSSFGSLFVRRPNPVMMTYLYPNTAILFGQLTI